MPPEPSGTKPFVGARSVTNELTAFPLKNKAQKIISGAFSWFQYYASRGVYPYYFEVIRLHSVRHGEQPLIATRPNGGHHLQHRNYHTQQVTHQIRQEQPTREEPPNPPSLNRALAPAPPPVPNPLAMDLEPNPIGRTDLVDLTQEDSDSEEHKKVESLALPTNPNSDTGTPRPPLNPEATNGHERKASEGQFSGDDPTPTCHPSPSQRDKFHDQSRADATPPNDKRLNGAATEAFDIQMKKRSITSFEDRVVALKAFREAHGHTNVQHGDDPELAKFCDDLRLSRNNPGRGLTVTNERVAALDELGFDWKGADEQMKQADPNSEPQEEDNSEKSSVAPDDSLTAGSSLSNDKTIEPEGKAPIDSGRIKLGTKVSKMFVVDNDQHKWFLGSGECLWWS